MNQPIRSTSISSAFRNVVTAVALACFALSQQARGVSPAPDGGYPGQNTAEGDFALNSLTTGNDNTALGTFALFNNTEGGLNTAIGVSALVSNTTGSENTATGVQSLFSNTTGGRNTASGVNALFDNTLGEENTATGYKALSGNTFGQGNTATGGEALLRNTDGAFNTATGLDAMPNNSTGSANTATGVDALFSNTTGSFNMATGYHALAGNTTGSSNIAVGSSAGQNLTTGDSNIDIGNDGTAGESNTIRIGGSQTNTFVAGVFGGNAPKGIGVVVDSTGHLGTKASAERFKTAIKPMNNASDSVLALKPVTFRYKHELDPDGVPQFGLVAEEVAKVNPDLVERDGRGQIYTVRYDAVNAMLLNEFLKEHQKVQKLEAALADVNERLKKQEAKNDRDSD